jgi:hypothetical protein
MAKYDDFEFTVKIRGTRYAANKILEQFAEGWEDRMIKDSMEGREANVGSVEISSLKKSK